MEAKLVIKTESLAVRSNSVSIGMEVTFALHAAISRVVRLHKPLLAPLGLTFPQYLVLLELFAHAPRTVGELGDKVDMDAGTITPLLKRLEAAGKVSRQRDPADERRVLVSLTPEAEASRSAILAVTTQIKSDCTMTIAELEALRDTLNGFSWPSV